VLDLRFEAFQSSIKVELYIIENVYLIKDISNEYWEQNWAQWLVGWICLGASLCTLKNKKRKILSFPTNMNWIGGSGFGALVTS
jgi:hypothetical protein